MLVMLKDLEKNEIHTQVDVVTGEIVDLEKFLG